ncbi:MAG: uroporphyrinogen-III C-methyltransferase [Oscillospiraceae bacterium]|nr:uroporphyrinogen-III C-methyltransferase [Oscillospiraceae bacterium]
MSGTVYLVGAGCGDYDLITLRGKELLAHCDTVIYDALIDPRLLDFAPDAEKICVGKRAGLHSAAQEEINALLIQKAAAGKQVVRLKGGDPFVFGRGGEEILALQAAGIPYSTVPGISSCIAAPELAGIPVTHRMLSRSFHVITGHTADDAADFSQYAGLGGTLVFLMGLRALPQIVSGLLAGGMPGDMPAAVIASGGTPQQRVLRSNLSEIAEQAKEMQPPALILVGQTAAFELSPTVRLPLSGVSVTVTGTAAFTQRVQTVLRGCGADAYAVNHLQIAKKCEIPPLSQYDVIALTSRNGAELLMQHFRDTRTDLRTLSGLRFAVLGSGTASVLEEAGIYPEIMPAQFTAAALGSLLAETDARRILLLRAEQGDPVLTERLAAGRAPFDEVHLYGTAPNPAAQPQEIGTDYLVFGSASGVRTFFAMGYTVSPHTKIVCIGRQTAKAAGTLPVITAEPHTAEGIAAAVIKEEEHETLSQTAQL